MTPTTSIQAKRAKSLLDGNDIRKRRSELRHELRSNPDTAGAELAHILLDPPGYLLKARIFDVLAWVPGIKFTRADLILAKAGITGGLRTIAELTERQRAAIGEQLHASPLTIFSTPTSSPAVSRIVDDIAI